jgi:hypothetical protein
MHLSKFSPILATILLLYSSGCARIADPQPPEIFVPRAATDLSAAQIGDSVLLTVAPPAQNTDGSPVSTLKNIEVLRISQSAKEEPQLFPLRELAQKDFLALAAPVLSIPFDRISSYLQDNRLVIQDKPRVEPAASDHSQLFRYAVIFVNNKGRAAGLSNQAAIQLISIPPAPEGISAETTQNAVVLKWSAPAENTDGSKPARIAGYNIYRSEQRHMFTPAPINSAPLQQAEFLDRSIEFDKTYFYAIRTVGSLREPFAESFPSQAVEVKTIDTFPPAPPERLSPVFENNMVLLMWTPSVSSDVSGYRIYRRMKDAQTRQLLQKALITGLSYRDQGIELNKIYEYSIQSVDTHGNESTAILAEVNTN